MDRIQPPRSACGVIGGDKAQGGQPAFLHHLGQQKAKGLLGVAAGKTIKAQVFAPVMGESFPINRRPGRGSSDTSR